MLFSGAGTNFENIIRHLHHTIINDETKIEIVIAITNKADAGGIDIANKHRVNVKTIEHTNFSSREEYDQALVDELQTYDLDLVVLSGFMRILTPVFTDNIKSINLHPSLLPLYKGAKAIERSFEGDEDQAGVSVHYVTSELDGGEIILQQSFEKKEFLEFEPFYTKIKQLEYEIVPKAILKVLFND